MVNKHDDIQRSILYLKHIDLHILSYIHTSNEMHSKACAHACAHAHMRMRTMSTFDRIDLLAWIGTAQIVPICFDTTHVLFDSGICSYSSQLNVVLAPLVIRGEGSPLPESYKWISLVCYNTNFQLIFSISKRLLPLFWVFSIHFPQLL